MSEDTGGQRRARRGGDGDPDDDARPVTAAGRRRAREADGAGSTAVRPGGKGTATPTRAERTAAPAESALTRMRRFLREVVAELRKVHWPTRRQIVVYTGVVLVFVAFMVALVYGLDAVFAQAVFALFG